jgi:flagellar assembly protein FliH
MPPANKPPDGLPPEQLTAYERWELPAMDETQKQPRDYAIPQSATPPRPKAEVQKQVKPPTAAELESIRDAAYKEGLDQGRHDGLKSGRDEGMALGLEEGRKKGLVEGQKKGQEQAVKTHSDKITRHLQHLESMVNAMVRPLEEQRQAMEDALLQLVLAVARAVVCRELSVPSEQILAVIRGAVSALPEAESAIRISVHPDDLAFIQGQPGSVEKNWKLLPDPKLTVGSCRVETNHTLIDFTREKRFQQIVDQLLAHQSDPEAAAVNQQARESAANKKPADEVQPDAQPS